jgi:hypothetical protein
VPSSNRSSKVEEGKERRAMHIDLQKLGISAPASNRMITAARKRLADCDEEWRKKDSRIWLSDLDVLEHHEGLAQILLTMCEVENSHDESIMFGVAMHHDISKTMKLFAWLSHRRKTFNWLERWIMSWHPLFAAWMVWDQRSSIRREERPVLWEIMLVTLFHHKPWFLINEERRMRAWKVKYADGFKARCEKRHREDMPKFAALHKSFEDQLEEIPWYIKRYRKHEFEYVVNLMIKCFGQPDKAA